MLDNFILFGYLGISFILVSILLLIIVIHEIRNDIKEILIGQKRIHYGLEILLRNRDRISWEYSTQKSKENTQPEVEGESKPDNVENGGE